LSIVIAACTEKYGLIIADTRRIILPINPNDSPTILDDARKIRQPGEYIAIGAAGDGVVASNIFDSLIKDKFTYLEDLTDRLKLETENLELGGLPLNLLFIGYTRNNHLTITALSSGNGFISRTLIPQGKPEFGLAPPTDDPYECEIYRQMVKRAVDSHKDIDDLHEKLSSCIKEIHKINKKISGSTMACIVNREGGSTLWRAS
jgi:hypothetical protein